MDEGDAIRKMNWPNDNCRDELLWMASKGGKFSTGSCHDLLYEDPKLGGSFNIWGAF